MKSSAIPVGMPAIPGMVGVDNAVSVWFVEVELEFEFEFVDEEVVLNAAFVGARFGCPRAAAASVGSVGWPSPFALKKRAVARGLADISQK